jgi:hypothetical protein
MEVEMKIRGLMMDPVTQMPIVVLKDVQGQAVLPIWVGAYEANAIALEIEKVQTPRPMTPARRHVLRVDLGGAWRGIDEHRFEAERCVGVGAADGLPDLRG